VRVGQFPIAIASGEGAIWVTVNDADAPESWSLKRIDPATNEVTHQLGLDEVGDVAVGAGSVWVAGVVRGQGPALIRVDPRDVAITATIPLACDRACALDQIVVEGDQIWATTSVFNDAETSEAIHVDAMTNEIDARVDIPGDPRDLAIADDSVWVYSLTHFRASTVLGGSIYRIDPAKERIAMTLLEGQVPPLSGIHTPTVLAAAHGHLWTSRMGEDGYETVRIGLETNKVEGVGSPGAFYPFGVEEGGIWFRGGSEDAEPNISRLVLDSGEIDASLPLDSTMIDATLDLATGTIWVADYERRVSRIDL
jgi:streptogramin lyase